MLKIFFFVYILLLSYMVSGQSNFLLGKIYIKSTGMGSSNTLHFYDLTSGYMSGSSYINGREIEVGSGFSYQIQGTNVEITYSDGLGKENYFIHMGTDELQSRNEGYVNGEWNKIKYTRSDGPPGSPGTKVSRIVSLNSEKHCNNDKIIIGNQTWSCPNLNVDHFRNGDKIIEAKSNEEWIKCNQEKIPAWCYYNNDSSLSKYYGKLYNYYAIIDPRGLAPKGWRIPKSSDWDQMIDKFDGKGLYNRSANHVKERRWWANSEISAETTNSNTSGFDAKPAGVRNGQGAFFYEGYWAVWWNEDGTNTEVSYDSHIFGTVDFKGTLPGLSVRLIKDYENFQKLPKNVFSKSEYVITDTRNELTAQGTINKIETKELEKTEITFNNDKNQTAVYIVYRNSREVSRVNGKWTIIEENNQQDFVFTYSVSSSSGYQTSYGTKNTRFKINYDEDHEIKSIGLNIIYERENYNYIQQQNKEAKAFENRFNIIPEKIIGTPIKYGDLEVSEFYYTNNYGKLNYEDATKLSSMLGEGWRLPTDYELLQLSKKSVGIITPIDEKMQTGIWSSTESENSNSRALALGTIGTYSIEKRNLCYVRFVKGPEIEQESASEQKFKIIGDPIDIGSVYVANGVIDYVYKFEDARQVCLNLGGGWRLPTKKEMEKMIKKQIPIPPGTYWLASDDFPTTWFCIINSNNEPSFSNHYYPGNIYYSVFPVRSKN